MRIVVVALSDPLEDTRLRVMSAGLARTGAEVTVVAPGRSGDGRRSSHGSVTVLRVPVTDVLAHGVTESGSAPLPELDGPDHAVAGPDVRQLRARARKQLRDQNRRTRIAELKLGLSPSSPLPIRLAAWARIWAVQREMRVDALLWRMRSRRQRRSGQSSSRRGGRLRPDWRRDLPYILDHELAFAPVLDRLEYDVIHAHGYEALSLAAHAVALAGARGRRPALVYDADCCPSDPDRYRAASRGARRLLEEEYIADADVVTASSGQLARRLKEEHDLPAAPVVVRTTPPLMQESPASAPNVREAARLREGVPLLAYVGTCSPLDGVHVAIRALPLLPLCHLAIVTPHPTGAWVTGLTRLARLLDCHDRLHVLHGRRVDDLPSFLSTADVGVFPLQVTGDAALRLDAKLFQYLQAGLPVVATRIGAVRTLVEGKQIGETFAPRDHEDLADATLRVLADPGRYEGDPSRDSLRGVYSWKYDQRRLRDSYAGLGLSPVPAPRPLEAAAT